MEFTIAFVGSSDGSWGEITTKNRRRGYVGEWRARVARHSEVVRLPGIDDIVTSEVEWGLDDLESPARWR